MRAGHVLRRWAEVVALVAVALAPFAVYAGARATRPKPVLPWPADVAVAGQKGAALATLLLIHADDSTGEKVVVRWPAQTALEIPNMGQLRAETAFGIGGASLLAQGLAGILHIDVPYSASGSVGEPGAIPERLASGNLGAHAREVSDLVEELHAGERTIVEAPGSWRTEGGIRSFVPDADAVRALLGGVSPSPSPSPAPSPQPSASASSPSTTVEVLNAGALAGSASQTADALTRAGFKARAGTHTGGPVTGTKVYYRVDRALGVAVARALKVDLASVARLPAGLTTKADVLVLVGSKR